MYEKIGSSLCSEYDVHIIGHQSNDVPEEVIQFHPIFKFSSISNKRKRAGFQFLEKIKIIQPDLLIVHAPELLWFAVYYKLTRGIKLVYDVRENYWRNIVYQSNYKGLKKWILALGVRLTERLAVKFIDAVFLAESCYAEQMPFFKEKATILENKFKNHFGLKSKETSRINLPIKVVCTGTLSEVYGIERAILWVIKLRALGYDITLTLIGKISTKAFKNKITSYLKDYPFIRLFGNGELIPHHQILKELVEADVSILPYRPNKSTEDCIPTKLYEGIALKTPMLVQNNQLWEELCKPYRAAVFTDFQLDNAEVDLKKIIETRFYPQEIGKEVMWEKEEGKLLKKIESLFPYEGFKHLR